MNSLRHFILTAGFLLLAATRALAQDDAPMPFPPGDDRTDVQGHSNTIVGDKLPKLLHRVEPVIPAAFADGQKKAAPVWVSFVVTGKGTVSNVSAMFAPPAELAKAAEEAVRQWTFEPGTHFTDAARTKSRPVHTQMVVRVSFTRA